MRLITVIAMLAGSVGAPPRGAPGYRTLVASESGDIVTELTWDGAALAVVKVVPVGIMPADIYCSYCYAAHRDLPSFPTRRSSDLEAPTFGRAGPSARSDP